jgi:transposase InsO family protein
VPGNYKYAAVAVEYLSKWVEAKALRDITAGALQKFFWENIVCHFGVPKEVTVDNGKQFDYATLRDFTTQLGTKLCFASVYHPQSNDAVERANGIIFAGIKKNITELPKGKWFDESDLVPQHDRVEDHKVYPIKAAVRRRGYHTRGNQAQILEDVRRGRSERRRHKAFDRYDRGRQDTSCKSTLASTKKKLED